MGGLLITGTDTGVGKSVLAAAILAALSAQGERPIAHKPVITGTEELAGDWPPDDQLLASTCDMSAEDVAPRRYRLAASPHLAAALAGERLDADELIERARRACTADLTVVEGIGGLLVPFNESFTMADLARALDLPVVIAARAGLGTINHTLLTLTVAREAGLRVAAVVLNRWPTNPSELELSNRSTIAEMGEIDVAVLGDIPRPEVPLLAQAGETLPFRRWIAHT